MPLADPVEQLQPNHYVDHRLYQCQKLIKISFTNLKLMPSKGNDRLLNVDEAQYDIKRHNDILVILGVVHHVAKDHE
jgi:hypothetical protein